jgi:hypothetical protein
MPPHDFSTIAPRSKTGHRTRTTQCLGALGPINPYLGAAPGVRVRFLEIDKGWGCYVLPSQSMPQAGRTAGEAPDPEPKLADNVALNRRPSMDERTARLEPNAA